VEKVKKYKAIVEKELTDTCQDILMLVDDHLIPYATTEEAQVFFHKMKADYYRYIAEYQTSDKRNAAAQKAL
jgi:14-3-3 protein epsilon